MAHLTIVASFVCAVSWTMVAGATTTIGKNSMTCITFDAPLLDWKDDFIASQGIWLQNSAVEIEKDCGLNGDCGSFKEPSKIEMSFFQGNEFYDFSVSVWFKRQSASGGCWPVLVSNGDCAGSTIQISSMSDTQLMVFVRDSTGSQYEDAVATDSQSSEWRHVVVTVHVDKVSQSGWAKVYVDGVQVGTGSMAGKMPAVWYPMYIGANACGPCNNHYYTGLMDSISFARYELTPAEVRELYESRGLCIGEPGETQGECGDTWALIVAGSHQYGNYRHQADACHAYRILRNRGMPAERIVLMMYDDIADHTSNPDKGQIFNRINGPDVYDVIVDYSGHDVTAANFLNILRGDQAAMNGIGSGKVIDSGPSDNVFVFYSNHGGPGFIAFPTGGYLTATELNNAISEMHAAEKYRQMVLYIEACNSGSMFHNLLPNDINVYATTASSPFESSWGHYYSDHHHTSLGDEYSIFWMEDSDVKDLEKETVYDQFLIVRSLTHGSTVHEYGQESVSNSPVADFQTGKSCYQSLRAGSRAPPGAGLPTRAAYYGDGGPAEDVQLDILRRQLEAPGGRGSNATILAEIEMIEQTRAAVDRVFRRIIRAAGWTGSRGTTILRGKHEITDFACYEAALEKFVTTCFDFTQDQYALLQLQILVNLCEEGVAPSTVLQSITSVCSDNLDRTSLPNTLI